MNRFADFSRRQIVSAAAIVFVEVFIYVRYAATDSEFHFWLHGLFGASLGLLALSLWKVCRPKSKSVSPLIAGFIGHIYSAVPDIIFIVFGVLHMYWMDISSIHISIHFIPAPVTTMLVVFLLSLLTYGFIAEGARRLSVVFLTITLILVGAALVLREPIPATLNELQNNKQSQAWSRLMAGNMTR